MACFKFLYILPYSVMFLPPHFHLWRYVITLKE
uniref:Uncharacterized protein n=1 Tax=Rhizophora mucronata TaxID=61149 RepID=A0A2P2R225_RHIMU